MIRFLRFPGAVSPCVSPRPGSSAGWEAASLDTVSSNNRPLKDVPPAPTDIGIAVKPEFAGSVTAEIFTEQRAEFCSFSCVWREPRSEERVCLRPGVLPWAPVPCVVWIEGSTRSATEWFAARVLPPGEAFTKVDSGSAHSLIRGLTVVSGPDPAVHGTPLARRRGW